MLINDSLNVYIIYIIYVIYLYIYILSCYIYHILTELLFLHCTSSKTKFKIKWNNTKIAYIASNSFIFNFQHSQKKKHKQRTHKNKTNQMTKLN